MTSPPNENKASTRKELFNKRNFGKPHRKDVMLLCNIPYAQNWFLNLVSGLKRAYLRVLISYSSLFCCIQSWTFLCSKFCLWSVNGSKLKQQIVMRNLLPMCLIAAHLCVFPNHFNKVKNNNKNNSKKSTRDKDRTLDKWPRTSEEQKALLMQDNREAVNRSSQSLITTEVCRRPALLSNACKLEAAENHTGSQHSGQRRTGNLACCHGPLEIGIILSGLMSHNFQLYLFYIGLHAGNWVFQTPLLLDYLCELHISCT